MNASPAGCLAITGLAPDFHPIEAGARKLAAAACYTIAEWSWSFAFIGASTMVMACHKPNERNKVQAFNDFLVFGSMAIGSFSSGQLLANFGWNAVNEVVFPVVLAASALLIWGALSGRGQARAV